MVCREHEDELRDLAAGPDRIGAGGLGPTREARVRAHLAGCAACREALETETQLFAAVDAALREEMNAKVPASLEARIRMAAAAAAGRPLSAWLRWATAGTAVAAVVVLMMVLRPREGPMTRESPARDTPTEERTNPPEAARPGGMISNGGQHTVIVRTSKRGRATTVQPRPEVLVPAGEQAAFLRFAESLQARGNSARGLLRESAADEAKPLQITPMELARLDLKPLEAVKSDE